jgi:hypothetical protein
VRSVAFDATDPAAIEAALPALPAEVDVLVNNAGGNAERDRPAPESLADVKDTWLAQLQANVITTVLVTTALTPRLRPDGRVIGIGSIAGVRGSGGSGAYGAAKAAVQNWAADAARRLGRKDAPRWEAIADDLFVPWANGVLLNHDRFTPAEGGVTGATPEVLAGLFPIGYCAEPATERATIEFYLDRIDEFIGYPMLSALLGVYAAWIGDRRRSLDLFERGYADFILEPFSETDEFSRTKFPDKPRVGPFQANLGGFLSACLYGLPGIRVGPEEPSGWPRRAVTLPAGWDAIEVERLWVRGSPASLHAAHGAERARLELRQD